MTTDTLRPKHLAAVLVLLFFALGPTPAQAAGVVSACNEGSLKTALQGGGSVTFTCNGTIALTSTITVAADTTIDGTGQDITISGNHVVSVLSVNPQVTLRLNKLTIANGIGTQPFTGGGVNNRGTLLVSNSAFSANSANWHGGGIYNTGTVTVTNSTFSANSANYGGGAIANESGASLAVSNSTFSGNSATYGGGGAVLNSPGTLAVSNSTFSGNSTTYGGGGAILNGSGTITLTNSTFSGNSAIAQGGGIQNSGGTVTLKTTIVANSPAGGNCYGAFANGGGNLSYPDTTCPGINRDPRLGSLQDNGGPTYTMALGPGSAAIDNGIDAICAAAPVNNLDQRGMSRPQGPHCDIGAYESELKPGVYLPLLKK